MRRRHRIVLIGLGVGLLVQGSPAAADGLVIEVYTADDPARRPDEADEVLPALFDELEDRGFDSRGRLGADVSRVWPGGLEVPEDEVRKLGAIVNAGLAAYSGGRWAAAEAEYKRVLEIARHVPAAIVGNAAQIDLVYRALLGRAMALKRSGKEHAAELMFEEAIRSFPGMEPSRAGAEVVLLWRGVRDRLAAEGTGALIVECTDPAAVIFVNLGYSGSRSTTKTDLFRGEYHVFAQAEGVSGRSYSVPVSPGRVSRLEIDWSFDAALRTQPYVGFEFGSSTEHREHRYDYAAKLARRLGKARTAAVGLSKTRWGYALWGFVVDANGRPQREGYVWIHDLSRADEIARGFARYLAGDPRAGDIQTEPFDPTAPRASLEQETGTAGPVLAWTSAAATATALGIGLTWMALDETCLEPVPDYYSCRRIRTKTEGIIGVSTGVGLGILSGYLMARSGPQPPRALRDAWRWVIGGASLAALAGGTWLIAIDQPNFSGFTDTGAGIRRPWHRPTLLPGGIATAAGAIGLGTSVWLFLGSSNDDAPAITPLVEVTADGTSWGVAGHF